MPTSVDRLDQLAEELIAKGEDGQRLELVRRARIFKRSWLEMAEALLVVRRSKAYARWGYKDLYAYCAEELQIRKATVDKLTGSYMTISEHAPKVLERDGVEREIPALAAVDYFNKAVAEEADASSEVVKELRTAVFDDVRPVASIRKEFNPLVFPKPAGYEDLERLEKVGSTARRLINLLRNADQLPRGLVNDVLSVLEVLDADLDERIPPIRESFELKKAS